MHYSNIYVNEAICQKVGFFLSGIKLSFIAKPITLIHVIINIRNGLVLIFTLFERFKGNTLIFVQYNIICFIKM